MAGLSLGAGLWSLGLGSWELSQGPCIKGLGDGLVPPPLWHCFGVFPRNCIIFGWCSGHWFAWMGLLRVPPAEPPVLLPPQAAIPWIRGQDTPHLAPGLHPRSCPTSGEGAGFLPASPAAPARASCSGMLPQGPGPVNSWLSPRRGRRLLGTGPRRHQFPRAAGQGV